ELELAGQRKYARAGAAPSVEQHHGLTGVCSRFAGLYELLFVCVRNVNPIAVKPFLIVRGALRLGPATSVPYPTRPPSHRWQSRGCRCRFQTTLTPARVNRASRNSCGLFSL